MLLREAGLISPRLDFWRLAAIPSGPRSPAHALKPCLSVTEGGHFTHGPYKKSPPRPHFLIPSPLPPRLPSSITSSPAGDIVFPSQEVSGPGCPCEELNFPPGSASLSAVCGSDVRSTPAPTLSPSPLPPPFPLLFLSVRARPFAIKERSRTM